MGLLNLFHTMPSIEEGLKKMEKVPGAVLLDVRSPEEYADGHLEGSINLPINRIPSIGLAKETPLFIYCLSGARAARAEQFLKKSGYDAVNIGGISGYKGKLVR